jgi:hypothetical protein
VLVVAKLDGELDNYANQNRPDARRANDGQNLRGSSNLLLEQEVGKRQCLGRKKSNSYQEVRVDIVSIGPCTLYRHTFWRWPTWSVASMSPAALPKNVLPPVA